MQIYRENWQLWGSLGRGLGTKTDNFLEKFQTAFDAPTPLICRKLCCNFFIMDTKPSKIGGIVHGCIYASRYEGQIVWNTCNWFPEKGTILKGGGWRSKVVWNFSENSSVLVPWSDPFFFGEEKREEAGLCLIRGEEMGAIHKENTPLMHSFVTYLWYS